jgi:hypothetical protein
MLTRSGVPVAWPEATTCHIPETIASVSDSTNTEYSRALAMRSPGRRLPRPEKYARIPAVSWTKVCDPVPQNNASSEKSSTIPSGSEFVNEAKNWSNIDAASSAGLDCATDEMDRNSKNDIEVIFSFKVSLLVSRSPSVYSFKKEHNVRANGRPACGRSPLSGELEK